MRIDDIFEEITRLQRQLGKEMDRMSLGKNQTIRLASRHDIRTPLADVRETEKTVVASFEIPGAKKEDIDISIVDRGVAVKINRETKTKDESAESEKSMKYYRRMAFPKPVDVEKATASYENGILRIEAPKAKRFVRKLEIE